MLKRWETTPKDLTKYILDKKLTPYDKIRQKINFDIYHLPEEDRIHELEKQCNSAEEFYYESKELIKPLHIVIEENIYYYLFDLKEVIILQNEYITAFEDINDFEIKELSNQKRHKDRCRAIAEILWKDDPEIPIEKM